MSPELAAIVFGLASAASWGAGDFSGGVASRRNSVYAVVVISQIFGVILLAGLAFGSGEPLPAPRYLILGALAGVTGAIGAVALYMGLAGGHMGVVAPLTAVVAAGVPVAVGAALEGLPGDLQLLGFGFAFVGVWSISRNGGDMRIGPRDLGLPLIAGLGFGLFFILIDQVSEQSVYWPLVSARFASISMLTFFAFARRRWEFPARARLPLILLTGLLEAGGNVFFALATAAGRLDIASVLASLYPAATVFLAWALLKERLTPRQWLGIVAVLVAIILITA